MNKAAICLWFRNNDAADAARFYAEIFPASHVGETGKIDVAAIEAARKGD